MQQEERDEPTSTHEDVAKQHAWAYSSRGLLVISQDGNPQCPAIFSRGASAAGGGDELDAALRELAGKAGQGGCSYGVEPVVTGPWTDYVVKRRSPSLVASFHQQLSQSMVRERSERRRRWATDRDDISAKSQCPRDRLQPFDDSTSQGKFRRRVQPLEPKVEGW